MSEFSLTEWQEALRSAGKQVIRRGNGAIAQCPAHDDGRPSLSITAVPDGSLVHCHAGCEYSDIARSVGFEFSSRAQEKLQQAAEQRLRESRTDVHYIYTTADGEPVVRVTRSPGKEFRQSHWDGQGWANGLNGHVAPLYRLPDVVRVTREGGTVYLTEGEKDADALVDAGVTATTTAGGAQRKWIDEWTEALRGASVVIVRDKDDVGKARADRLYKVLHEGAGLEVTIVEARTGKDAWDHLAGGATVDQFVLVRSSGKSEDEIAAEELNIKMLDVEAMLASPPPPIDWAWDGIAARGSLAMVFGAGKTAKSFLAMEYIITALNGGGTLLGRYVNPAQWALMIDAENGERRLTMRLWEFGVPDKTKNALHVADAMGANLADPRTYEWVSNKIERIRPVGPGVILFDSVTALRDVGTDDEWRASVVRKFINRIRALIRPQDVGLFIHHENGEGRMSGSRDWRNGSDAGLRLEKSVAHEAEQAYIKATLDFSRDSEDGMVVGRFRLKQVEEGDTAREGQSVMIDELGEDDAGVTRAQHDANVSALRDENYISALISGLDDAHNHGVPFGEAPSRREITGLNPYLRAAVARAVEEKSLLDPTNSMLDNPSKHNSTKAMLQSALARWFSRPDEGTLID